MNEIEKETEQRNEKSSSDEERLLKEQEYRWVHPWVSAREKVNIRSSDPVDRVLLHIQERLDKFDLHDETRTIFETYSNFNVSVGDHKPAMISIGPNYRDTANPDLKMEFIKLIYTFSFFEDADTTMENCLRANPGYFNSRVLFSNFFNKWSGPDYALMEMLIVDGCFIIDLFRGQDCAVQGEAGTDVRLEQIQYTMSRDLLLPDNQLPFKFLEMLFEIREPWVKSDHDDGVRLELTRLAFSFLERIVPNQKLDHTLADLQRADPNLLSIVYDGLSWLRPKANINHNSSIGEDEKDGDDKWNSVKSATELQEFGVEFEMVDTDNLINITFIKGVLYIPRIRIRYGTAFSISKLLWFENCGQSPFENDGRRCLNDYLWFMNSLVKSPSDVQLLRQKNIIDNLSELLDDAALLKFLKDLYESLMISPTDFRYKEICRDLNAHCSHRRNRWLAKLNRDYLNSPWAVISFFAASLLLILTVVQTGFSVASFYSQG